MAALLLFAAAAHILLLLLLFVAADQTCSDEAHLLHKLQQQQQHQQQHGRAAARGGSKVPLAAALGTHAFLEGKFAVYAQLLQCMCSCCGVHTPAGVYMQVLHEALSLFVCCSHLLCLLFNLLLLLLKETETPAAAVSVLL